VVRALAVILYPALKAEDVILVDDAGKVTFFICWFTGPPTWNSGISKRNKN
jgi:hypothetical protein